MQIGILSLKLPPERCGVGDYSLRLTEALQAQKHQVTLFQKIEDLRNTSIPLNAVFIQYSPSLFYPIRKIASTRLERLLLRLKQKDIPATLVAHEIHYPVELNIPGILLGVPQFLHFKWLLKNADRVFFTYEVAFNKWKERLNSNHLSWIPVGSNIKRNLNINRHWARKWMVTKFSMLSAVSTSEDGPILLHFGGIHPTHLYSHLFAASELKNSKVLFVGTTADDLKKSARRLGYSRLPERAIACGYLAPSDVSICLTGSDLLLAPFMDGVSARRGSVMAALEHGLPVLTNSGWATDSQIPWNRITHTVKGQSKEDFLDLLQRLLASGPAALLAPVPFSNEYFRQHFSWEAIAHQFSRQTFS